MKSTGDLSFIDDNTGSNLLQIAIMRGWFIVTKYLIDHYGFDVAKVNDKQFNWNSLFYCVNNKMASVPKLCMFRALMKKYPIGCCDQVDFDGNSIFFYATLFSDEIAEDIFIRELKVTKNFLIEKKISILMGMLQNSVLDAKKKLEYLNKYNILAEDSVKSICDYMQKTGDLRYTDMETGHDLLQIAIDKGWLILKTCLVEHFGFVISVTNEKKTK